MIIDRPKTLRKTLLQNIPLPDDKDIIVYNTNFAEFLYKDVEELYEKDLSQYNELSNEFVSLSNELNACENFINNVKLVNKSYDEKAYIQKIQELEIKYAQKYKDIKDIEKRISLYENKVSEINTKIDQQKFTEQQSIQQKKKDNIELLNKKTIELGELKTCMDYFMDYYNEYDSIIKMIRKEIEFEENLLTKAEEKISFCKECGKRYYPSTKKIKDRISSLEFRLKTHNDKYIKLKERHDNYKDRIKSINNEIKSLKEIIKMSDYSYIKKSNNILSLEGQKFEIFEEINKLQEKLQKEIQTKGKEYNQLKTQIDIYKTSFANYNELKSISKKMLELQEKLKPIKEKIPIYENNLELITQFLEMKYKVYEKNLNVFFDNRVKIKLFEKDGYNFKKICQIKFDNIDAIYLDAEKYTELNNFIVKKLKILSEEME